MPTSGTYTFTANRDQVIRMALLSIEKLDEVEVPTPQETTDCAMWLNMMVKQWQGKADFAPGLKVWTRRHGHLFLQGTTGDYTVGPGGVGWTNNVSNPTSTATTAPVASGASAIPVASVAGMSAGDNIGVVVGANFNTLYWSTITGFSGNTVNIAGSLPSAAALGAWVWGYTTTAQQPIVLETAFLRDNTGNDTPLKIMTSAEYDYLPSKNSSTYIGDPTAVYLEYQLGNSILMTDVAGSQDLTKHICLTYMEAIQDFNNPQDTPEYPQEWLLPLALGLGKLVAPMYHAAWTPLLQSNFETALSTAQGKEPKVTTMFFNCNDD